MPRRTRSWVWTYWIEWGFRWSADPQTLERVLALAQQAACPGRLPADSPFALEHRLCRRNSSMTKLIAEGERAVALDPNYADSYAVQAEVLNFAGRPEEALQSVEQAMRLNPRCPPWYLF